MTNLEKSILKTVVYFDCFDSSATVEEIYQYLLWEDKKPLPTYADVLKVLEASDILGRYLTSQKGLWCLAESKRDPKIRHQRARVAIQRFKRVKRYQKWIISVPFVDNLYLSGSLTHGIGNSKADGDIDFFIVSQHSRIWTARFLLTLLTDVLRIRRKGDLEANRFCLNHYVDETYLTRPDYDKDYYSAEIYLRQIGMNAQSDWKEKFLRANLWVGQTYPNMSEGKNNRLIASSPWGIKKYLENFLSGNFGDWLEGILKDVQMYKIQRNPKNALAGNRILVSDQELEFHPMPNGPRLMNQLESQLKKYSLI
jgi:hypothetical protein